MATTIARKGRHDALKQLTAADVIRRDSKSIHPGESMTFAAEFLRTYGIETAPVTDNANRLVGVVSGADLFDHWGRCRGQRAKATSDVSVLNKTNAGIYPELPRLSVGQIMNPEVACVAVEASIAKVMESFVKHKVRRLFVTDNGVLVGDISVFDLLRELGECVAPKRFHPRRPK
jgi:CBS-domain-containing membrane protein